MEFLVGCPEDAQRYFFQVLVRWIPYVDNRTSAHCHGGMMPGIKYKQQRQGQQHNPVLLYMVSKYCRLYMAGTPTLMFSGYLHF